MTKERLVELIQSTTAARDEYIQAANQQVAFMNGKLEAYQALLAEMDAPPTPPDAPPVPTEETAA